MKTSILKALTYRVFGTLVTAGIALLVTHRWQFVGLIGGADFAVKVAAYFLHEEFWRRKGAKSASVLAPSWNTGAEAHRTADSTSAATAARSIKDA